VVTAHLPATGTELGDDPLLITGGRGHLMAGHDIDGIAPLRGQKAFEVCGRPMAGLREV
jgi:hypothetical protein